MGKELFKNIPSKVGDLVKDVRNGRIGLPDLQRPFVWKDNKVRELFDSMLKGYPIGYIMLWESPTDYENKKSAIGSNVKTYETPKELVIDGQQRLTALVAAMHAVKVKDKHFADREIKISYNPLTQEFAVWTQAFERDAKWISRISDVFLAKDDNSIGTLRRRFIKEVNESRNKKGVPLLTDEEEDRIENNINALLNLSDYSLPTLEISYTADEEDVADIFVRVNSGGQSLTENNFIQTIDKHHIFPKNHLSDIGYTNDRDRNQIANFTYLDYATNIEISDKAPKDYITHYRQKLGEDGYREACENHALPVDFENMQYPEFLK